MRICRSSWTMLRTLLARLLLACPLQRTWYVLPAALADSGRLRWSIVARVQREDQSRSRDSLSVQLVSNLQSVNLYSTFRKMTVSLWTLWELVLVGESVMVSAPTPQACSDAVLALVSLISPVRRTSLGIVQCSPSLIHQAQLNYCGDYRPFFTIHDSEFKEYTRVDSGA